MSTCLCPGGPTLFHNGAGGDFTCMECGIVLSENTLVSEVSFGETSGGAAMAHGTLVADGSTHARTSGGRRGGEESSEQAVYNGKIRIAQVATAMSIPDTIRDSALRFYKLAVVARFTKGRKSRLVVAACLYAACQHTQFGYMLIDFSDMLQVNVFELGATYLSLIKVLHIKRPYTIDPAHYIHRFAALLEFGDDTPRVAQDAVRLVARFRADWMNTGRRPAGICGASLLLAARMNNFRRSVQEIVQVVKIADQTLIKRLKEFEETGSSALTVSQFRDDQHWLPEAMEAPPIVKAQEKQKIRILQRKRKKREMDGTEDSEPEEDAEGEAESVMDEGEPTTKRPKSVTPGEPAPTPAPPTPRLNFNSGIFRGVGLGEADLHPGDPGPSTAEHREASPHKPLFLLEDDADKDDEALPPPQQDRDMMIDPALYDAYNPVPMQPFPLDDQEKDDQDKDDHGVGEEDAEALIAHEMEAFLNGEEGAQVEAELEEAERARKKRTELEDKLDDLDEDELDQFLLTEEEVKLKTRVWVELNRDYLEKLAAKKLDEEEGVSSRRPSKPKKPKQKPRDSTTARGATPAESVGHLLKKKKFSRKINYDAVKNLFKTPDNKGAKQYGLHEYEGFEDDEEKDDEGGLSTIDPDPEVRQHDDAASGYSAAGDGDDSMYAQDDYYDDGGYEEEV